MRESPLTSRHDEASSSVFDQPERRAGAGPSQTADEDARAAAHEPVQGMIPVRSRRRTKLERASLRTLATGGIIGIATALGAVLVSNDVAGWIVGLTVGLTSVILAAVLWSSRQL